MTRLVPQWLFYFTVAFVVSTGLLLLFVWRGVVYDAAILISREGITIFDARPRNIRMAWNNMPVEIAVDETYRFLIRCIPLVEEDRKSMEDVVVVIVSERRLQIILFLSLGPKDAVALYHHMFGRIYVVSTGDLAHELIHHYIARRLKIATNKHHEHFLFSRCQSYDPAISFHYRQ